MEKKLLLPRAPLSISMTEALEEAKSLVKKSNRKVELKQKGDYIVIEVTALSHTLDTEEVFRRLVGVYHCRTYIIDYSVEKNSLILAISGTEAPTTYASYLEEEFKRSCFTSAAESAARYRESFVEFHVPSEASDLALVETLIKTNIRSGGRIVTSFQLPPAQSL